MPNYAKSKMLRPDTAVLYVRTGVQDQKPAYTALAQKLEVCYAFAQQEGYEVVAEYQDMGVFSLDTNRIGLRYALESVKSGKAKMLICHSATDLTRRGKVMAELLHKIQSYGGNVPVSTNPSLNQAFEEIAVDAFADRFSPSMLATVIHRRQKGN